MATHTRSLQRWTLVLGGSFLVLVTVMAYLLWNDHRAAEERTPVHIDAKSLRITRDGFADIELSRSGEQWQLQSPCQLAANEQRLKPLLDALVPKVHHYDATDVDLAAAGLIDPRAIVFINDVEHRLGNTDLNGERRYLQRGNTVEFAPEWILSLVNGGTTALAELEVFPEPITQLLIEEGEGSQTQTINGATLEQWQGITAQQIVTWPIPDQDLDSKYRITALGATGKSRMLSVFETDTLTAITFDDAQCAYILSAGALPTF